MRIADAVLSFFQSQKGEVYSPIEIARYAGFNRNTIRRVLQELHAVGALDKPQRGQYTIAEEIYFRHYVAMLAYCGGDKKSFYALTYDTSNQSLERKLLDALLLDTISDCGNHRETGYSVMADNSVTAVYPVIEIGEL